MSSFEFDNHEAVARLRVEADRLLATRSPKCLDIYRHLQNVAPSTSVDEAIAFAYTFLDDYSRATDAFLNLLIKRRQPPSDRYDRSCVSPECELKGTVFKFEDWRDQLELLLRERCIDRSFAALIEDAGVLLRGLRDRPPLDPYAPLDHSLAELLHGFGDTLIHWDQCGGVRRALNPHVPWSKVAAEFLQNGHVNIDSLLTDEMLITLRRFTELSTIFYRFGSAGYVGAYINDGFCNAALFQIVTELKEYLTPVIGGLPLTNMWAYRYQPSGPGVRAHSDTGRVTVNFWLTPDSSNVSLDSGGLILYDAEFPRNHDWMASNLKKDSAAEQGFFEAYLQGARQYKIPYRQNRCVLFKSNLLHSSMPYCFGPNLHERRVNVTIIFGGLVSDQLKPL